MAVGKFSVQKLCCFGYIAPLELIENYYIIDLHWIVLSIVFDIFPMGLLAEIQRDGDGNLDVYIDWVYM